MLFLKIDPRAPNYLVFQNLIKDIIFKSPLYEKADIINLHWVVDFDYETFLSIKKPVVWTLHDMHPLREANITKNSYWALILMEIL